MNIDIDKVLTLVRVRQEATSDRYGSAKNSATFPCRATSTKCRSTSQSFPCALVLGAGGCTG